MLDMYTRTRSPYLPYPNYTPRFNSAVDVMIRKTLAMLTMVFVVVPFCISTSTLILEFEISRSTTTPPPVVVDDAHGDKTKIKAKTSHDAHDKNDKLEQAIEATWVNIVKGNNTQKQSCGPSFCFSAGSADCFQKHPAPLCLKAVYLCIQYVMTGPNEPQVCMRYNRPRLDGEVGDHLEEMDSGHSTSKRWSSWQLWSLESQSGAGDDGEVKHMKHLHPAWLRLLAVMSCAFVILSIFAVMVKSFCVCRSPRRSEFEDPLLEEEGDSIVDIV